MRWITPPLSTQALVPEARWLTDRYEFMQELGRGGISVVYLARERGSGRLVALKLLGSRHGGDAAAMRRFAREARTVSRLDHPNIVRTLAIEEHDGSAVAIVSVYVPNRTLRQVLREWGKLSFDRTAQVLRDVASALAYAHRERIVHRDVKPENIFIDSQSTRALLSDFGIARPLDGDTLLTAAGSSLGTPNYMSPEQVVGATVDERTDVYALGLVGWEMLAGQRPWEGETLYGVLHKQQHEQLPALADVRPGIPDFLRVAIEGALHKDPNDRWRDGEAFYEALTSEKFVAPSASTKPVVHREIVVPQPVVVEPVAAAEPPVAEPVVANSVDAEPVVAASPAEVADAHDEPHESAPEMQTAELLAVPNAAVREAAVPDAAALEPVAPMAKATDVGVPNVLVPDVAVPNVTVPDVPMADAAALAQEPLAQEPLAQPSVAQQAAAHEPIAQEPIAHEPAEREMAAQQRAEQGPPVQSASTPVLPLVVPPVDSTSSDSAPSVVASAHTERAPEVSHTPAPPEPIVAAPIARTEPEDVPIAPPPRPAAIPMPVLPTWPETAPRRRNNRRLAVGAAGIGAALLLVLATTVKSHGSNTNDRGLDSLLAAASARSGGVYIGDSLASGKAAPAPAGAAAAAAKGESATSRRGRVRSEAAGRLDLPDPPRNHVASGGVGTCASRSVADQRTCLLAAIQRNDAALTRTYQTLITQLRRQAGGAPEPPAVQSLRAEQRTWLDERDRACRAQVAAGPGNAWAAALAPCFAQQSAARNAQLQARLRRR